jgi:hypothetical protein
MKKVRDNLFLRTLAFELKFIVNEFPSVIGGASETVSNLETRYKLHISLKSKNKKSGH